MVKLNKAEKKQLIKELRAEGWIGNLQKDNLLLLAKKVLEYQLKKNERT